MNVIYAVLILMLSLDAFPSTPDAEEIQFLTSDGVNVFGYLYRGDAEKGAPLILLFHQAGGDARGEYGTLIGPLLDSGYQAFAIDQRVGGSMLQTFGLLMDLLPRVAKMHVQIGFEAPVSPDDPQCFARSRLGEPNSMVSEVLQVAALGETFDHSGDGGRLYIEALGQRARRGGLFSFGERVYGLQVVFYRAGKAGVLRLAHA